jgi:hypothetical protein
LPLPAPLPAPRPPLPPPRPPSPPPRPPRPPTPPPAPPRRNAIAQAQGSPPPEHPASLYRPQQDVLVIQSRPRPSLPELPSPSSGTSVINMDDL